MPHDLIDDPLMAQYAATAKKLSEKQPVKEEEMCAFLGVTGLMLVRTLEMLWTQAELERQIDDQVSAAINTHAHNCRLTPPSESGPAVAQTLIVMKALLPFRWPIALAVFSPFASDITMKVIGLFRG